MIEINNLTKKYGNQTVLDDFSFSIFAGNILGVMGKNGAGKTTLIKTILKETDYSGSISIQPELMYSPTKLDFRKVYVVSDSPHTYEYLSGLEYILFVLQVKGYPIPDLIKVYEILEIFGLTKNDANRLIKDYSFGMRRKVVLVAGFLVKPKLMVLDEPTIGLDVPSVITMKKLILKAAATGITFIITSHDPSLVAELCSSLLIIHDNKMAYYNANFQPEAKRVYDIYLQIIGDDIDKKVESILNI